jgi:hypothetical protein
VTTSNRYAVNGILHGSGYCPHSPWAVGNRRTIVVEPPAAPQIKACLSSNTNRAARRLVEDYVEHYKEVHLNNAVGYMLAWRQAEIHAKRDLKLEEARKRRQIRRQKDA